LVDGAALDVEFVANVAHDFLEHVLEGDDAGELLLGVQHDGEMAAREAEFLNHRVERSRELELHDGTDQRLEGRVGAEQADLPEPFADEEQAANVVERTGANRETAVAADLG